MAKSKRLNKRVVVLLVVIGLLAAAGAIGYYIHRLPKDVKAQTERGRLASEQKRYRDAIEAYGEAIRWGKSPELYVTLGNVYLEYAQNDTTLPPSERTAMFMRGKAAYEAALQMDPRHVDALRKTTDIQFSISRHTSDWVGFIRKANDLLAVKPDEYDVLYQRSVAEAVLGQNSPDYIEQAIADLRKLIEVRPERAEYWQQAAMLLARSNRKDEADALMKQALEKNPDSVELRLAYAGLLEAAERKDDALAQLREARQRQPKKADAYIALAMFHLRQRQNEEGLNVLNEGVAADPLDFRSYLVISEIRARAGEFEPAEQSVQTGLMAVSAALGAGASTDKDRDLGRLRNGVFQLNHRLADLLLDRIDRGDKKEELLPRVQECLQKMQDIAENNPAIPKIKGRLALLNDKRTEAEQLLRTAYEGFNGNDLVCARLLINLYYRMGLLGEAEKIINRQGSDDNPGTLLALAHLQVQYRRYEDALRLVEKALRLQAENQDALGLRDVLLVVTGRSNIIPPSLKKIMRSDSLLIVGRARQLYAEGRLKEGMDLLRELSQRDPGNADVVVQVVGWYKEQGNLAEAQRVVAQAETAYKENPALVHYLRMMVETDPGKRLESELQAAGQETDPFRKALRTAETYRQANQQDKYVEHLLAADKLRPDDPIVIELLFQAALGKSDWAEAEKYAKRAAEVNLDQCNGRMYQAQLARGRGQLDEAVRLASEALQLRPRFSQGHAFLGLCYVDQKQYDLAKEALTTAYEQNPANLLAMLGLIQVAQAKNDQQAFAQWVDLAYRFSPDHPDVREAYLMLHDRDTSVDDQLRHREQIARVQPNNVANLVKLGALYERMNRPSQAESIYRQLCSVTDNSPAAMRLLTDLLRRHDRDADARDLLAKWVASAADKVAAYLVWAEHLLDVDESAQARSAVEKAIELGPKDPRGYLGMVSWARHMRQPVLAVEYQQKYMEVSGDKVPASAANELLELMIDAGQFDQVKKRIDEGLNRDLTNTNLLCLRGLMHLRKGEYDQAMAALSAVTSMDAKNTQALTIRAQVHRARGDKASAVADLEQARAAGATSPLVITMLIELHSEMEDFPSAYMLVQTLLAERPNYEPALRSGTQLCRQHQKWAQLEPILAAARRSLPRDPFYVVAEADMLMTRGQSGKAIEMLNQARRTLPDNADLNRVLMRALVMDGQLPAAEQLAEGFKERKDMQAPALAISALIRARQKKMPEAEARFQEALKASTSPADTYFIVQQIEAAHPDNPKRVTELLKQWQSLRPDDWQYHFLAGQHLLIEKQHDVAAALLARALELAPDSTSRFRVLRQLGLAYYQLQRFGEAEKAYLEALKILPNDFSVLNNLAWMLASDVKDLARAKQYAEKAVAAAPKNAYALDTQGTVLLMMKEYEKAIDVLHRSADVMEIPANRFHLGQGYEAQNRKEDAVREYRRAWELIRSSPGERDYVEIQNALKRLGETPSSGRTAP